MGNASREKAALRRKKRESHSSNTEHRGEKSTSVSSMKLFARGNEGFLQGGKGATGYLLVHCCARGRA